MILLSGALILGSIPLALSGSIYDAQEARAEVQSAAENLYGSSNATTYPGNDTAFEEAFPGLELYYVLNGSRTPAITHAMAYDDDSGDAHDITDDYNALLPALIPDSPSALDYAEAFAHVGNTEFDIGRQVVNESDNSWLGTSQVKDPSVTTLLDGWEVQLWTWNAENGVLSSWYFLFGVSELQEADRVIRQTGVGPFSANLYATNLEPEMEVYNTYDAGHAVEVWEKENGTWHEMDVQVQDSLSQAGETVATRTNFDTSTWTVKYDGRFLGDGDPIVEGMGQAYADAAVHAYGTMVEATREEGNAYPACHPDGDPEAGFNPDPNWGFHGWDADCGFEVILHNASLACFLCVEHGTEESLDTTLHVDMDTHVALQLRGFYQNDTKHDDEAIARTLTANMYIRYLDHADNGGENLAPSVRDGLARAAQAAAAPQVEHDPSSLFFGGTLDPLKDGGDDAGDFMRHPGAAVCNPTTEEASLQNLRHHESYALFWVDAAEPTLTGSEGDAFNELTRTLGAENATGCHPSVHGNATYNATFDTQAPIDQGIWEADRYNDLSDVFMNFSQRMYTRNFTWTLNGTTLDWGEHLPPVSIEPLSEFQTLTNREPWSLTFVNVTDSGTYTVDCSGDDPWWTFQLLHKDASGDIQPVAVDCSNPPSVDGAQWTETVFVAFRAYHTTGGFSATTS